MPLLLRHLDAVVGEAPWVPLGERNLLELLRSRLGFGEVFLDLLLLAAQRRDVVGVLILREGRQDRECSLPIDVFIIHLVSEAGTIPAPSLKLMRFCPTSKKKIKISFMRICLTFRAGYGIIPLGLKKIKNKKINFRF